MKEYTAVLVGCGARSRDHIHAYDTIPNVRVTACYAPTPVRREALAAEFGLRPYADLGDMLAAERPDIVHLITWPDTRVELMTLVSDMGVPLCTVEKPIVTGVCDWRALCALHETTRTRFAVSHQVRWQPYLERCRRAVSSGRLGDVQFVHMSAGMNISGQGTHTLNYGRALCGDLRVAQVTGNAYGWDDADPGHPAPAGTVAALTFENGVRGLWTSGDISPRAGDLSTSWQHVRVAAFADRGRALFEEFGKWEIVSGEGNEQGNFGDFSTWKANNITAQAGFHQAMLDWLEDPTCVPGTHLGAALHEWKVVLGLYTSAVTRRPVDLEGFEPDDDLVNDLERALR